MTQWVRRSLSPILLVTGMYFLVFFSRSVLSPLLVPMEKAFSASHAESAGLMLFFSAGFGLALALSGWVSSRFVHKKVLVLGLVLLGLSLLVLSMACKIAQARLAFCVLGIGSGLYLPSGMATLASVTPEAFWGRAIAIHELAPNLAFLVAPVLIDFGLSFLDWREVCVATAGLCILGALIFRILGKGGEEKGVAPNFETVPKVIRNPAFWAVMVLMGLGVGLESGPYSITPLYLVSERGFTPTAANRLLSTARLATPLMALVGGWLADRFSIRRVLAVTITGSAVALVGMGFCSGLVLGASIALQAAMPALMFPVIFKAVTESFGVESQSLVLSLSMPVAILVALGGVPTLLGLAGDQGHFGYGFAGIGILTASTLFVLPMLEKGRCDSALRRG